MFTPLVVVTLLLQVSGPNTQTSTRPVAQGPPTSNTEQAKTASSKPVDAMDASELLKVKRIYVDSFGDDAIAKEMQSMIVSALVASKRFKVTENRERADAILKGVALEKTSQEVHAYGEGTAVGGAAGSHSSSVSGGTGSSSGSFVAHHMATDDSSLNTETVNDARVAVRLVNPDGDVIWTSTQESRGAKYKGSSADVADRCVKQLLRDVEKLESNGTASVPASVPSKTQQH